MLPALQMLSQCCVAHGPPSRIHLGEKTDENIS
jgi:hypothetical protein